MKRFSQWSIRYQLLLSLGVGLAMILLPALYYNYQITEESIKTESQLYAKKSSAIMTASLLKILSDVETSTSMLAVIAKYSRYSEAKLSKLLKKSVENNAHIYGASIAFEPNNTKSKRGFAPYFYRRTNDEQTVDVLYSDLAEDQYDYINQPWYVDAKSLKQAIWSEPYFDDGGGNISMITYTLPILLDDAFYAVVTGDVDIGEINRKIQSNKNIKGSYALLLDRNMNIISSPNTESLMKPAMSLLDDLKEVDSWNAMLSLVAQGGSGVASLPCLHEQDSCFVVYQALPINNWPLLIVFPEKNIYTELDRLAISYIIVAVLSALILSCFVVWLTNRLTQPLVSLTQLAANLGRGEIINDLPNFNSSAEAITLSIAFKKMQVSLLNHIQRLQDKTAKVNRLEGELSAAAQIQMDMLPNNGLSILSFLNVSLWAHVKPAKSVGGDLYHFRISENAMTFIIGDVSDKGVAASLFMATTVSLFKQCDSELKPNEILDRLNQQLEKHNNACMFVTAFVGELNLSTGELIYSCAGHPAPLLHSAAGVVELAQDPGPALGLFGDAEYTSSNVIMPSYSQLIAFSDGVDEAFNKEGEMYGIERLKEHVSSLEDVAAQMLGESIIDSVKQFSADRSQSDDIAVMIVEFMPKFTFLLDDVLPNVESKSLCVNADVSSLPEIMQAIENELACYVDSGDINLFSTRLLIEEVFVNAIHYGELHFETVILHYAYDNGYLLLEMIDSGLAFNPLKQGPEPELGLDIDNVAIGGLGIHLILSMSERQKYLRLNDKNHLCLLINCMDDS